MSISTQPATSRTNKTVAKWQICASKGPGTKGRKVRIEVNYLLMGVQKIIENAFHYDVKIAPDMPKRLMKSVFHRFNELNFPATSIAFDGRASAYAPCLLNLGQIKTREVQIVDPETHQTRKYLVDMKAVRDNKINLSCLKS